MSADPTPRVLPDLSAMAEIAKAVLLKQGSHAPTFILDGDRGAVILLLADGFAAESRARQLQCYRIAAHIPMNQRRKEVGTLRQVTMIAEAWSATLAAAGGQLPAGWEQFRASEAPDRKEVLTLSRYLLDGDTQEAADWEILRTAGGVVHDLMVATGPHPVSNALLECFVAGWRGIPLEVSDE